MINIAQTITYVKTCDALGIEPIPRFADDFGQLILNSKDLAVRENISTLIAEPETVECYMELVRVYSSLIAIGIIPEPHAVSLINVRKFSDFLSGQPSQQEVHNCAMRYQLDDMSRMGSWIGLASDVYSALESKGMLNKVFSDTHLDRLLELHRYMLTKEEKYAEAACRPLVK